jgi:Flp pilus assembly protein TadD
VEAERHFLEAIRSYRPDAGAPEDPRVDYGAFLVRQGRAEEALEPLKLALSAQPISARFGSLAANRDLGRALLDLDRPSAALPYLEKAVVADPAAWNIRMLLGKTYLRLGRMEDGERELRAGREGWAKADHGSSTTK